MNVDVKTLTKDVQDRIRTLAYLMWESAGKQQNMAMQYWLNAEREILSAMQAATDVMMPRRVQTPKETDQPGAPEPVDTAETRQIEEAAAAKPGKAGPPEAQKPLHPTDTVEKAQEEAAAEKPSKAGPPEAQKPLHPTDTVEKAQEEAAAEKAAARKPAARKTGSRRKTTK